MYDNRQISLYAWDWGYSAGMGGFVGSLLWVYLNFGVATTLWGKILGFDWSVVERIAFFYPFLAVSVIGSFVVFKQLLQTSRAAVVSSGIFSLNTYILMVVGGGQIAGVGMAYALSPLVLYGFILSLSEVSKSKVNYHTVLFYSLCTSLLFSLQVVYDLRIAYVTIFAVGIYVIFHIIFSKNSIHLLRGIGISAFLPLLVTALLHTFWIYPTIFNHGTSFTDLGAAYTSTEAVKYFSFGQIEHTVSLLHPYWPENIFGLVHFLNPIYLVLPFLAFSSLLFLQSHKVYRKLILFFCTLGLVGVFLAKGSNDPFGYIYLWMFENFPGFVMFRDPFKWYVLIILSYSFLIPFTVWSIYDKIKNLTKNYSHKYDFINAQNIWITFIILVLLFLIHPALFGKLNGNFEKSVIPQEYNKLEQFISSQNSYSRTLWIPTVQRYGFYSAEHPAISGRDFFQIYSDLDLVTLMQCECMEQLLKELSVKYIIVPSDAKREIYINDRKYDSELYEKTIEEINKISYLKRIKEFNQIGVFEITNPRDHVWSKNVNSIVKSASKSPVEYSLDLKNVKKGETIFFSEKYDTGWLLRTSNEKVLSEKYEVGNRESVTYQINSFKLPKSGTYSASLYYSPQDLVNWGSIVSGISFTGFIATIGYLYITGRKK
jgi:hypothetical protein